ncbi:MAG: hypothetical protein ACT4O9_06470 [Blastocatellia bacterium]
MTDDMPAEPTYPWYKVEKWGDLQQGDLLPNCPILILPNNLSTILPRSTTGDQLKTPLVVEFADLIVMSQSCDLAQEKITQVLLCAHFPASNQSKSDRISIRKEQRPALHMIEKCDMGGFKFEKQIVDFRTVFTLPKNFLIEFTGQMGTRVRLLSPYREHLSQAFARYFMRVGLPRPLSDD